MIENGVAHDRYMDFLKVALANARHDTDKCNTLSYIMEAGTDDEIWPKYKEQFLKLSEKNLKEQTLRPATAWLFKKHKTSAINNFGYLSLQKGDNADALNYFNHALKIQEEINDKKGSAASLNNIGRVYQGLGEGQKALEHYLRSLRIVEEFHDNFQTAAAFNERYIHKNLIKRGNSKN